jgi:hypothetical protein
MPSAPIPAGINDAEITHTMRSLCEFDPELAGASEPVTLPAADSAQVHDKYKCKTQRCTRTPGELVVGHLSARGSARAQIVPIGAKIGEQILRFQENRRLLRLTHEQDDNVIAAGLILNMNG